METGDTLSFENPDASPAEAGLGSEGEAIVLRASGYTIACTPDAQNPHVSEGARKKGEIYVIYKTVVTCTGTGNPPATATIRVRGGLMWDSAKFAGDTSNGIKWSSLRSSEETRTVKVNGSKNTFYTPKSGLGGDLHRPIPGLVDGRDHHTDRLQGGLRPLRSGVLQADDEDCSLLLTVQLVHLVLRGRSQPHQGDSVP